MRLLAVLLASIAVASCGPAQTGADASKAAPNQGQCRDDLDVQCLNDRLMRRLDEDDRQFPKLKIDMAFGEWRVVTAVARAGRDIDGKFVSLYAERPVWRGSLVTIAKGAITLKPSAGAPVIRSDNLLGPGELYPHCTSPKFDPDLRNSASAMEGLIDPWQHFGLQYPWRGRYLLVSCQGGPEFPDDGSEHQAETTVEEANGVSALYLYSPDLVIVSWGGLELLLQRAS